MATDMLAACRQKRLCDYPIVLHVDPASEHAMYAAMARAREVGLIWKRFTPWWVRAPGVRVMGLTVAKRDGDVRVFLRDDLGPVETYRTMLHELQHVADAQILGSLGEVKEERAEAFAARAGQWAPVTRVAGDSWRDALIAEGRRLCAQAEPDHRPFTTAERHRTAAILFELDVLRARRCGTCGDYDCGLPSCFRQQLTLHRTPRER